MACNKCQEEKGKGKKYCRGCGEKLVLTCPLCNAEIHKEDHFCGACGHDLFSILKAPAGESSISGHLSENQRHTGRSYHSEIDTDLNRLIEALEHVKEKKHESAPAQPEIIPPGTLSRQLSPPQGVFISKNKFFLIAMIFYAVLIFYVLMEVLFPHSQLVQMTNVFQNFWANFVLLALSFLIVAVCVYGCLDFFQRTFLRMSRYKPKLGKILVKEGYVTKEELDMALMEQRQKLGEILIQKGQITTEQLAETLSLQKKLSGKLGEILKEQGYLTEEHLNRALNQMNRRLGDILCEKGILTENELAQVLALQHNRKAYEKAGARPAIAL